jgi:hypothetical protein
MPRTKSSSIVRFDVCCVRGLPNKPMVFPFTGGTCAPRRQPASAFIPDSPSEIRRRINLDWQFLNLRLSTPVSSANITPFTDMHCGLSHASDSSLASPRIAPRQRSGTWNPLQTGVLPHVACGGAHVAARRFKTKISALPPPRMRPIRPLLYSEQPASHLGKSPGHHADGAPGPCCDTAAERREVRARNDSCEPC